MKRGYVDTPEGQVHYREEGTGEPLLLLHKAGLSSDEFTEMLPFLGKKYRAVAMDALGYGNTEMPVPEPGFDDYVKNILHFLDAMKLKKTNIAGHLLGSSFAVEIAAVHPEKVKKLILWDGIFLDEVERKATQEEYSTEHMEFKVDGSHLMKVWNSRNPKPSRYSTSTAPVGRTRPSACGPTRTPIRTSTTTGGRNRRDMSRASSGAMTAAAAMTSSPPN